MQQDWILHCLEHCGITGPEINCGENENISTTGETDGFMAWASNSDVPIHWYTDGAKAIGDCFSGTNPQFYPGIGVFHELDGELIKGYSASRGAMPVIRFPIS